MPTTVNCLMQLKKKKKHFRKKWKVERRKGIAKNVGHFEKQLDRLSQENTVCILDKSDTGDVSGEGRLSSQRERMKDSSNLIF